MGDNSNNEKNYDNSNSDDGRIKIDGIDIHRDVYFRTVRPTDIPICATIEKESYPSDEMASLSTLQYRQHHAARYFRCAVLRKRQSESAAVDKSTVVSTLFSSSSSSSSSLQKSDIVGDSRQQQQQHSDKKLCTGLLNDGYSNHSVANDDDDDDMNQVIGFICSTRCCEFTKESMYSQHDPNGTLLAIHSVVITKEYRHYGIATAMMKDYVKTIIHYDHGITGNNSPSSISSCDIRQQPMIEKIVLLSKANLLSFYVNCGFQVMKPSAIAHGKYQWYDLILNVRQLLTPEREYNIPNTEPAIPCYIVDAFANPKKNGTGNPAAVVVLNHDVMIQKQFFVTAISNDDNGDATSIKRFQHTYLTTSAIQWMQLVANEFNLSETAFVWPFHNPTTSSNNNDDNVDDENNRHYYIKYFTPTVEVPLCGHATLASASVMYQTSTKAILSSKGRTSGSICFHTVDDNVVLETHLSSSSSDGGPLEQKQQRSMNITMNFPTAPVVEITKEAKKMEIQQMLCKALRIDVSSILYMGLVPNLDDLLIELTYDSFMELSYDDIQYSAFLDFSGRGIIISCLANTAETSDRRCVSGRSNNTDNNDSDSIHFYSRFFAPMSGIDEDPVTGSAHCALSVYYSNRLNGKLLVIGYQKSKRSGIVSCDIIENGTRVQLTGTAVMAVSGTLWW